MIGIYIHLALCKKRCNYCGFNTIARPDLTEIYTDALLKNIESLSTGYNLRGRSTDTIYLGGGTPSIFTEKQIEKILWKIRTTFRLTENPEITIEANPESITTEKIAFYKAIGINRISIGIQTFNERFLKCLGRIHTTRECRKALAISEKHFKSLSVDLMYGLPGQTRAAFARDIEELSQFNISHISAYLLTRDTKSFPWAPPELPSEEAIANFFRTVGTALKRKGILQYEISNHALQGFECIHNIKYWTYQEYIGFGAGAHSFLFLPESDNRIMMQEKPIRFEIVRNIPQFILSSLQNEFKFSMLERPSSMESRLDYISSYLRLNSGLSFSNYENIFHSDFRKEYSVGILKNLRLGNIALSPDRISLTCRGQMLSNQVFLDFFTRDYPLPGH